MFAEHHVRVNDGLRLYIRDYLPVGAARGAPVLCLHGLTRNSADFEGVAPRLAALGRRVVVPDMRGRGRSDHDPRPERYQAGTYRDDVVQILDTLQIPRAVFIGTSMGGIITMLMAAHAPERMGAAVLNDIGPELSPAGLARIANYVGKAGPFADWDGLIADVRTAQRAAFPKADDTFWHEFARRVGQLLPDGRVGYAYDKAIANAFAPPSGAGPQPSLVLLFEALAAVDVLLIRGALSDLLSMEGVAVMKKIKPDMAMAVVPDVGHAPTLEEDEAWRAIELFLSRGGV